MTAFQNCFVEHKDGNTFSIQHSKHYSCDDAGLLCSQGIVSRDKQAAESKILINLNTLQKRRPVVRACDDCRRKKIKCNGKQPCTHCAVYGYGCRYDQPSKRRRNSAQQSVEALEARLQKVEAFLRVIMPDLDLDDFQLDAHTTGELLAAARKGEHLREGSKQSSNIVQATQLEGTEDSEDLLLEAVIKYPGCIDVDSQGHWDYNRHTSGIFSVRQQLGASETQLQLPIGTCHRLKILEKSKSGLHAACSPTYDLPPRAAALQLCRSALDDGCVLMRFVHEPSFYEMFDRIYDIPSGQFSNAENSFLPLLYMVLSVGCLFFNDGDALSQTGYENSVCQGFQFFKAGRYLLDMTDCCDLTSLQTICFMVLFLQFSAKLSACYSYIDIALRTALRLGLHRPAAGDFNALECEIRKRVFWVIRKMDVQVSTTLGLPIMLREDDIGQEYPINVDSEFISVHGITSMPDDRTPIITASNAQIRLTNVAMKVVRYIYPAKGAVRCMADQSYKVSYNKIREIERDLQAWVEELPSALRPGLEASSPFKRVQLLLRIRHAHVQIMLYWPFLHYVCGGVHAHAIDQRSYAFAATCVSVARNIVNTTIELCKSGPFDGTDWLTIYTTYYAVLSLLFFAFENSDSPLIEAGILDDAVKGKNTLASLAKKSPTADQCFRSLVLCHTNTLTVTKLTEVQGIFKNIREVLKKWQNSKASANLKYLTPSSKLQNTKLQPSPLTKYLLQRASILLTYLSSRSSANEANNSPKDTDDNILPENTGIPLDPTPELAMETVPSLPKTLGVSQRCSSPQAASSMPFPVANQNMSMLLVQPLSDIKNVPNHMLIVSPSSNPSTYPMRPMLTLEDDQFREDDAESQVVLFNTLYNADVVSQHLIIPTTQSDRPSGATMSSTIDSFFSFGSP